MCVRGRGELVETKRKKESWEAPDHVYQLEAWLANPCWIRDHQWPVLTAKDEGGLRCLEAFFSGYQSGSGTDLLALYLFFK